MTCLRHKMYWSGMPAEVLQRLLGHKDIQTAVNTYTTIFDKYKAENLSVDWISIPLDIKTPLN